MMQYRIAMIALTVAAATGCYRQAELYPSPRGGPVITDTIVFVTRDAAAQRAEEIASDVAAPTSHYINAAVPAVLPAVPREFRGVWVATVGNLDWPSKRSLTTARQQEELLRILDAAQANGLNAVIFQVRTMADAFYDSPYEPWSDYLTGASGRAPEPYWDPLHFAVEQAHARGLELHAWFNPFRAGFKAKKTPLAARHVSRRRPDLVREYGTHYWLDPGEPDARRLALDVIADVVRRYDVDAVHVDDYFYPYLERDARGRLIAFPDDASWREHGIATGMTRNDWRRSNIDTFIEQMYRTVRAEKRHVRVGISPFGIWRPGHPATVRGLDSFNELYADTRKWLVNGWADYYAPQLYWRTYAPQQDYATLLQWWSEQNPHGRHIWAGNIPNSIGNGPRGWPATEIVDQVQLTRASGGATGNVHFSAGSLLRDVGGVFSALRVDAYQAPALVPASPWLSDAPAPAPIVTAAPEPRLHATLLTLRPSGEPPSSWIVRSRYAGEWKMLLLPGRMSEVYVDGAPELVVVAAVDRAGVEGIPRALAPR